MSYQELKNWASKLDIDQIGSFTTNQDISGRDRKFLYDATKKLRNKSNLSERQLNWLYSIFIQITEPDAFTKYSSEKALSNAVEEKIQDCDVKHLVLRLAWHDNKWNGSICLKPEDNSYCVGEHSLLSDRIRKRRKLDMECKPECAGFPPEQEKMPGYQPPCFWSINAFGKQTLDFEHDNPVAPDFPNIKQNLVPYSVISWPFKLAFVRDKDERNKYGSYYPRAIFESRIEIFQKKVKPDNSLVFLYCKYSNPVSGEDMDYLVAGCALLKEKGDMEWFDIDEEQLSKTAEKLKQPNFPDLNWALRYTLDFEDTGIRIPYHEYLELMNKTGGIEEKYLKEISVTVNEPELRDGFSYVAKQVDDDQAIYLLMKIRRSLLKIKEHEFLEGYDYKDSLDRIDYLLEHTWIKRGYFPGLKNLMSSIPGVKDNYFDEICRLVDEIDLSDKGSYDLLITSIEDQESDDIDDIEGLLEEISEFIESTHITADDFLRLSSINLTENQFSRILNSDNLVDICSNPYLLFEEYEPFSVTEDKRSGEKIDGLIDLFKIDISLFPHSKYLKKIKNFHSWKVSDKRRLRSVVISILKQRESNGDCYLETNIIEKLVENYPLFYKFDSDYKIGENLSSPTTETEGHFQDKIVFKKSSCTTVYYLKELFDAEVFVEDQVKTLLARKTYVISPSELNSDIGNSVALLETKIGESFDQDLFIKERENLYSKIINQPFTVLTGAPGSGKSYELLKVIDFLGKQGETHIVLTLTGKAALRLRNNDEGFSGINAKTMDKFLTEARSTVAQGATSIIHNLIIDESSMIDLPKLDEILRLVRVDSNHFKRLILVGDENQLPPIGFGKPFSDIVNFVNSKKEFIEKSFVYLESNCRAELPNSFIDFTRVFSGENKQYEIHLSDTNNEQEICDGGISIKFWNRKDELYSKIDSELSKLLIDDEGEGIDLPSYLGIKAKLSSAPDGLEKFQVLSPIRSGFSGVSGINLHFQEDIRTDVDYLPGSGDVPFKLFDKVMHTSNEYKDNELFVSNGSLGGIVANRKVFFLERDKSTNFYELRNTEDLELAYAVTVHKSQGSGFNHVFCVLPEQSKFISRELLYTALTRTKNKVTIFIHKPNDDYSVSKYLSNIRKNSSILNRRTSLFIDDVETYGYNPEQGVNVKSRVEYIIYRKLIEGRERYSNFSFTYEEVYPLKGYSFDIHPDFVLHFDDGRTVYWEHLGRVTSKSYMRSWDKRRKLYEEKGDFSKVLTTDELSGISDEKIELIVEKLATNEIQSEDSFNRYSDMHFSLR